MIEKLVKDGFVKREKKQMLPTEDGVKLITVLPDVVKSPKLTADWENALTLVAKGEYSMQKFMDGIEDMVKGLVQTYHCVSCHSANYLEAFSSFYLDVLSGLNSVTVRLKGSGPAK